MEISNAAAGNAYAVKQSISLAMMDKAMGISADVIEALMPSVESISSKALEMSVNPHLGGIIDVSV